MTTGRLLSVPLARDLATDSVTGRLSVSGDIFTRIVERSARRLGTELPGRLDSKRLIERAMQIDTEQSGSPLTEGQWDYGLDMLARADAPREGTGLAVRQERIMVALSRALAELEPEPKPMVS
jgi:hypothetical protein